MGDRVGGGAPRRRLLRTLVSGEKRGFMIGTSGSVRGRSSFGMWMARRVPCFVRGARREGGMLSGGLGGCPNLPYLLRVFRAPSGFHVSATRLLCVSLFVSSFYTCE